MDVHGEAPCLQARLRRPISPCPARDDIETGTCIPACWRSELASDEKMIDRDRPTAIYQEIQHRHRPHQRVFEARFVPKISADAPTLVIGYDEKDQDRAGDGPREQPERKHRPAHELRDGDRRRPEFSGTIAVAVQLSRQLGQIVRLHPGRWEHPERVAQPMRDERQSRDDAQQRLGPGGERLIERSELRQDERRRVSHLVLKDYSRISPRLMLAPRRASTDFLLRPVADISTRYVPEPSSSLSNLKSP